MTNEHKIKLVMQNVLEVITREPAVTVYSTSVIHHF